MPNKKSEDDIDLKEKIIEGEYKEKTDDDSKSTIDDEKIEKLTKAVNDATQTGLDIFRQIWLAGVGAFGKASETVQTEAQKASHVAEEVFENLVKQGEKVEELVKTKLEEVHAKEKAQEFASKAQEQASDFAKKAEESTKEFREKYMNDEKLESYKKSFSEALGPLNIFALNKRIEEMSAKISELEAKLEATNAPEAKPKTAKTASKPKAKAAKDA